MEWRYTDINNNKMQKINIKWLWFLGGLLFLNLGLMLYIFVKDNKILKLRPERTLLHEALAFSPEQMQKFEILRKEHHEMMKHKNEQIKILKDQLFIGFDLQYDEVEAKQIASKVGQLVAELDLNTLRHFQEVKTLCTDEQKVKFDEVIANILKGGRPEGPLNRGDIPNDQGFEPPFGRP